MSKSSSFFRKHFFNLAVVFMTSVALFSFTSCEEPQAPIDDFRTPTITGKVCIPEGMDIEPGDVSIKVVSDGVTRKMESVGLDGYYEIGGLEADKKYTLCFSTEIQSPDNARALDAAPAAAVATTRGFGGWLDDLIPGTDKESANAGNIYMKPLGTIRGKAIKVGAEDNYDIDVYIPGTSYIAKTAEDGSFAIFNVPQGTHMIRFASNGYAAKNVAGIVLEGPDYMTHPETEMESVQLIRNVGNLKGYVTLKGTDGFAGINLKLTGENADGDIVGVTSADGAFEMSGIIPGTYTLHAMKEGYMDRTVENIVVQPSATYVLKETIILDKVNSVVSGTVTLEDMSSHAGTMLLLKSISNENDAYDTSTDGSGNFVFGDVVPGNYELYVSKSGFESKKISNIHVAPGSEVKLDPMELAVSIKSVTGKIKLELAEDQAGALVTATNTSETDLVYSAISNSDGAFTLAGMKSGLYNIVISKPSYNTVTVSTVDVSSDSSKDIGLIEVSIARGTITGAATLEGWTHHEGIKVELMKGTEVYAETTTTASGEYSFYVPEGNYSGIRYSCEDFASKYTPKLIALFANNFIPMEAVQLDATYVTVKGSVNVYGIDRKDNVAVKIEGTDFTTVTDNEGYYRFDHVPVARKVCNVVYSMEGAPDVIKRVSLVPSEFIEIDRITMLPNSGIAVGRVNLKDMTDHSGVTVLATPKNPEVAKVETETDAAGYFRVGNLITTEVYTLTFSKNGWDCDQSIQVSGLVPLEEKDVTGVVPVVLVDTTAPVIDSLFVNWGNDYVEGKSLHVTMTASDEGNYVETVEYAFNESFTDSVKVPFKRTIEIPLPDGTGTVSVFFRVYDPSGNVSAVKFSTLDYANYKYEVKGVLGGNDLHWTKDHSPYLMTGNILVEEGKELIIDPGVEVQVLAGEDGYGFYIMIDGTLTAVGTSEERIKFYGYDTGVGKFRGIYGRETTDSIISYADIYDAVRGVYGNININNMTINAYRALCSWSDNRIISYRGKADNVICNGIVYCTNSVLNNVKIEGDAELVESNINNASFNGSVEMRESYCLYTDFNSKVSTEQCVIVYSELENVDFGSLVNTLIMGSNMNNCGTITVDMKHGDKGFIGLQNNFWGYDKTREMNETTDGNYSFIYDYYDDFNLKKVDCSGYKSEPINGIGYHKDGIVKRETEISYKIGDIGPAGGIIFYVDEADEYPCWKYMEAMLGYYGIGSYPFGYYIDTPGGNCLAVGSETGIGTGKANTDKLVAAMGDTAYKNYDGVLTLTDRYAAKMCYEYVQGGYDDWFLPSKDELNMLYQNVQKENRIYCDSYFWSSSENNDSIAWLRDFGSGHQSESNRGYGWPVCPVRAF